MDNTTSQENTPELGMKSSKKGLIFLLIGLFIHPVLFSPGCSRGGRYAYDEIRATYGNTTAHGADQPERPSTVQPETLSGSVSIREAIRTVLTNNPEMDRALARIRQSQAMIDQALASFWPVLSAYGEYVQGDAPSAYLFKTIDQRKLPSGINFNEPGWFENYEMGFRGRLNLFNGGRDFIRRRLAESGLEIQELDRQSIENALIASTIQAYYNALASGEYIQIARDSVGTVKAQLRIMKVRYRAGGALRSDILSLNVRLAQAEEDLVRAENNYRLSISALANLFGMDPDIGITLSGTGGISQDLPDGYGPGLVYALANRPEVKKAREQVVQSRMALDMAGSRYLPSLDFQTKYYFDDSGFDFERDRENWTAGFILNWDFFTGLSTKAERAKAEAVLVEMLAADRQLTRSVQLDLKTAYVKRDEARARLEVTRASVEQAEESLRLVRKQYEGGSATITRYLDAELTRNRARIRGASAFYDLEKAKADLGRALGYWGKHAREVMSGDE